MNRLIEELQRLYCLPQRRRGDDNGQTDLAGREVTAQTIAESLAGTAPLALDPLSPDNRVRTLVISFEHTADWEHLARLYQGVQQELELPAPAVAVSGSKGYSLWFSLESPVPVGEARTFLEALRSRYLADISPARLRLRPAADPAVRSLPDLPPTLHPATGKWSAFIDPAMGAMFVDEPWLEMAPNLEKQADMLAALACIRSTDFQLAQELLQSPPGTLLRQEAAPLPAEAAGEVAAAALPNGAGSAFADPRDFLLALMNDPAARPEHRLEAAKALLPYFHGPRPPLS